MKIGVLKKGDQVLNVTPEFIAVQRKNGEVDIEKIVTIGYGNNTVQASTDEIMVTTF